MAVISTLNTPLNVEAAYQYCEKLARNHYENFPVASILLPRSIRRPVTVIYAFARHADDMADEGDLTPEKRLALLDHYQQALENIVDPRGTPPVDPVFIALADVLKQYSTLPTQLLFDLLTAFKQDVTKNAYADFAEVLHYCQHSANPIGRLMLHLTYNETEENLQDSDAICTSLQLINFLQDLKSDLSERDRCYIPQDEMQQFKIELADLKQHKETKAIQDLIGLQVTRASTLLSQGGRLGNRLSGFFGLEIRLITQGGHHIVSALGKQSSVYERPHLRFWHWISMFYNAFKRNPV